MNFISKMAERFMKFHRKMRRWRRLVTVLAAVVVFVTTYSLILPAITIDTGNENATSDNGMYLTQADTEEKGGTDGESTGEASVGSSDESDANGESVSTERGEDSADTGDVQPEDSSDDTAGTNSADDADGETLITESNVLEYTGSSYTFSAKVDEDSELPVGTELKVEALTKSSDSSKYASYYDALIEKLQKEYNKKNFKVSFVQFYDISFVYNGEEVEPSDDVTVKVEYDEEIADSVDAVVDVAHFDTDMKAEILEDTEAKKTSDGVKSVKFQSDEFSIYAIIGTEESIEDELVYPIEDTTFTASVSGYDISVDVPAKSFKKDVTLKATEQTWDDLTEEIQNQLIERGASENNSTSFDLRFEDAEENEIEPANKVNVRFTIKDSTVLEGVTEEGAFVNVYHAEEAKNDDGEITNVEIKQVASTEDESVVIYNENRATAEFETTSFSTYTISGSGSRTINLTFSHENADVKVVTWDYSNNAVSNLTTAEMPSNSSSDSVVTGSNGSPTYLVFFVKPAEGYVVTGATQDITAGNYTFNNVLNFYNFSDAASTGNNWNGFQSSIKEAQGSGYDFYLGYTLNNNISGTITIYTSPITLDVTAAASTGDSELKAGDTTTFTITLDPKLAENVSVSEITQFTVTVNGTEYTLTPNLQSDGTYTATINNYVVTEADVRNGSVDLNVSAIFKYTSTFTTNDKYGGTNTHESSGSSSASTSVSCPISRNMNLTISKIVTGSETAKSLDGTSNKEFSFTVTASSNGTNLTGEYTLYKGDTSEKIAFTNGSATVSIKDGESIILQLPNGVSYSISEAEQTDPYEFESATATTNQTTQPTVSNNIVTGTLLNATTIAYTNKINSGSVSFTKTGEQLTGSPVNLSEATFGLYKEESCEGDPIVTSVSVESTGTVSFNDIPVGTYYMKETKAPDNYVADDNVYTVTIDKNSSSIKKNNAEGVISSIENKLVRQNLLIKKVDSKDNSKTLSGAEFTLTTADTPATSATATSGITDGKIIIGSDGTATITGLPVGKYTLTETKAPDGYIITGDGTTVIEVTSDSVKVGNDIITKNQDGSYTVTIGNKAGEALPNTGGSGTISYTLGGIMLIALAGLMYGLILRRNNGERRFN